MFRSDYGDLVCSMVALVGGSGGAQLSFIKARPGS